MDGHVRAMLKKVTVNEGALNQTIQSLGGGEKGLKELIAYIMSWVREHKGENSEPFSLSPNFENLQNPSPVSPAFGYAASSCNPSLGDKALDKLHRVDAAHDLNQFNQPCTKSRRLMNEGAEAGSSRRSHVYCNRGTSVDMRGTLPEEFQYPKLETSTGGYSSISPNMLPGTIHEFQQLVPSLGSGSFSFASGQDDPSRNLAAMTRAARRNRIARQRQAAQQGLPRAGTAPASACGIWSVASHTLDLRNTGMFPMAPAAPAGGTRKVNNADMLTFLLQKELRPSDVGNLGRIILPKKEAEMHLPILALREGVLLQMEDFDTGYRWNIRYRFWPNNKSRMYLLENTGELVKSHNLQEGDLLILYKDQQGNYVLRGKKKVHSESRGGAQGSQQRNAHSLARGFPESSKTEEVLRKQEDFGMGVESDWSCPNVFKERDLGLESEDPSCHKVVKTEPTILVGDDDPFFKEDVMHDIGSTFGPGLLQPLERFPSLNLDFPLDEIIATIPEDDDSTESEVPNLGSTVGVVPKTEPTG